MSRSGCGSRRHGRHCASRPWTTSPACCRTFRCFETPGRLMSNGRASSVTVASPWRAARIARRVGSARAAKVALSGSACIGIGSHFTVRLINYRHSTARDAVSTLVGGRMGTGRWDWWARRDPTSRAVPCAVRHGITRDARRYEVRAMSSRRSIFALLIAFTLSACGATTPSSAPPSASTAGEPSRPPPRRRPRRRNRPRRDAAPTPTPEPTATPEPTPGPDPGRLGRRTPRSATSTRSSTRRTGS